MTRQQMQMFMCEHCDMDLAMKEVDGKFLCPECAADYAPRGTCEACGTVTSIKLLKDTIYQGADLITSYKSVCPGCRVHGCDACGTYTPHVVEWGDDEYCLKCAHEIAGHLNYAIKRAEEQLAEAKEAKP